MDVAKKLYIMQNIQRINKETKLEIGKYILLYEGEPALTQCANAVAVNLDAMKESTINNVYAMMYNVLV